MRGVPPAKRAVLHVLLVEDDPGVRQATRMLLSVEGYRVTAVASLAEALDAARTGLDLLVTDYHLAHGETGTQQVIAAIRPAIGAGVRAILVTGDTSTAVRELQRDTHLRLASKPLNAEELLSLLRELMAAEAQGTHCPRHGNGCGLSLCSSPARDD